MQIEHLQGPVSSLDLEGFLEVADRVYDPRNPRSAWELRYPLLSLAQNTGTVWQLVLESLMSRLTGALPPEQPTYYVLCSRPTYSLRATIWLPERASPGVATLENSVFAYDYPHNHDFDLLTVNCFGAGYETDLFRIAAGAHKCDIGDIIPARFLGRHRLSPGTMLFYEALTDVHVQVPVGDVSVALNFIPKSESYRGRRQQAFTIMDENNLRVSGTPLNEEARALWFARLMGKLASCNIDVSPHLALLRDQYADEGAGIYIGEILRLIGDSDQLEMSIADQFDAEDTTNYRRIADSTRAHRISKQ